MVSLTRILVATDFGPAADAALSHARELSRTFGASLHLLHVLENFFLRPTVADPRHMEAAAVQRLLDRLTDDDRRALHARSVVETSDHPADSIVAYARASNIDLIVIGTHGRTAVDRLFLGSVTERVMRTAPCPVLTVRGPEHGVEDAERECSTGSRTDTKPGRDVETSTGPFLGRGSSCALAKS
jgi:nucleotide-binding universal stress UspA family protein